MLRIPIPSSGPSQLTFSSFENEELPKPPNGIDAEINNDVILLFDDEEQAVNFSEELEDLSGSIDDNTSTKKLALNDMIVAIQGNEFIRGYLK